MSDAPLAERLNRETARIGWTELQPHFARGALIAVSAELDLIEAAVALAEDERDTVQRWLAGGDLGRPDDADAAAWQTADSQFWAVVVAPWVLIQEVRGDQQNAEKVEASRDTGHVARKANSHGSSE